MDSNTTIEAVQSLLRRPDVNVEAEIEAASMVISDLLQNCPAFGGYSDEKLELIERYLAAHLFVSNPANGGNVIEDQAGPIRRKYNPGVIGMGLNGSSYGQHLRLLDTSGCLSSLDKKRVKAKVQWAGTKLEEKGYRLP